jgi:CheY-like chemotaxis protein
VKLPLAIARTADEPERRHPTASEGDVGVDEGYPSLKGLRVLVVDDEPHSNEVVMTLLASCGAEIRVAVSAPQAREILRRWTPDILVCDIGMPGEDGYELITKLRAEEGVGAQLPAVALTAYASREDHIRLLSAGFQAHVAKPLDPLELVTVVANLARTAGRASA